MSETMKYYILVPFDDALIRQLRINHKIKWDKTAKLWYTPNKDTYDNLELFHILYFNVPFKDKDIVKKYGYRWDGSTKHWYGCRYIQMENMEDLGEYTCVSGLTSNIVY